MSKTKKKEQAAPEELEIEPETEVEVVDEIAPVVGVPASAPGGPVPGRKSLGVKEPIVFKWKVVGRSGHMIVTLFKSVEREEADAQLERLARDGYYTNLQIMEAAAKVEQPPQPKEAKKAKVKEVAKPVEREAAKSTPIRIPGKPPEPKKGRAAKAADAKAAKAGKQGKSKKTTKSKTVRAR